MLKIKEMKVIFFEGDYGVNIDLIPETVEEVAMLAKITKNAKAVKPEINLYFGSTVNCSIWLQKVSKSVQNNYISNKK